MAASVLLGSADNTGPHFVVGGAGSGNVTAGNDGGFGPVGPASWNRSLDRALDEAVATGCLNLSGRKLKEFPRSAANHDLTDTTRADLSRNRLSELPVEVCVFVSLESLNLYQNCLRSLPDTIINLQALTYLNISRNQLSSLPAVVCSLPLKVLIACNNKLLSLPEELGHLRHLTELDVSCNEIQTLPSQVGQLEALRDLNIRRNHLSRLPPELAELPLVRLDFSCNKITSIPVCYRRLVNLQSIILDNNPLQTPPAQICMKGKVHIFKFLNLEASKTTPDLPDYDRRPLAFSSCGEELYPGRPYGALDSGFNSVDSGDKRWSGNEPSEELCELPARVAEISRDHRQRRKEARGGAGGPLVSNGTLESELEQIDFIDSCPGEEEDEERRRGGGAGDSISLSSQFMAYIERRITREGSPAKTNSSRDSRSEDTRRHNRSVVDGGVTGPSGPQNQRAVSGLGAAGGAGGVERVRREAQLAALKYEEERQRSRSQQRDSAISYAKSIYPSRRSTHTDDSALFMGEERTTLSPTANQSPSYPTSGGVASCRAANQRPESFLYRLSQKEEKRRGDGGVASPPTTEEVGCGTPRILHGEDAELVDQLRKNIEARLKVSLPSDLGAALTDGVVLCHLANHVRPRSVPSIHVPSPAVPKLTMAKCRRNVENFLEACRRIGVPQSQLCLPLHILEERGLSQVAGTVRALLELAPPKNPPSSPAVTTATTTTPAPPLAM
ncbi:DISP complex protein LRCH3 isoform X2 [Lampris incognitus]|uniref:DISP complex protein LRCH3 isoform X2 n=1 Tax=Lampris incognitus TaxID=2546036 RepID=UPI0024B50F46|nr:DISP complex protein LRCH3 isoform X2 [Lampris incognitus]